MEKITETALIDTGPLVAIVNRQEEPHNICVQQFSAFTRPLVTTWPVVTEAMHLVKRNEEAVEKLIEFVLSSAVNIFDFSQEALSWIRAFIRKYADQRPDFADVSLMMAAETLNVRSIFTLDVRDFSVYRKESGEAMTIYPDPDPDPNSC